MATLRFHIVPNAKENKVMGEHGAAIKIKLRSGSRRKSERALRSFLADTLKVSERAIVLERGQKSREKMIRIEELNEKEVRCRLLGTSEGASSI